MIAVILVSDSTKEQFYFDSISDAVNYMISKNSQIKKGSAIVTLSKRIKNNSFKAFKGYSITRW